MLLEVTGALYPQLGPPEGWEPRHAAPGGLEAWLHQRAAEIFLEVPPGW